MSVTIISKDSELGLTQKKLESYKKYSEIIQYGRKNPVWWAETVLGVQMMDYQKYAFQSSWDKQFSLWLMSRNGGKSTLSAPFVMSKMMLYPNFASYILSLTAMQSQDTFLKMEAIAKRQIESFVGLNDIFIGEVVSSSNHDGFVHHPQGFRVKLYNGSFVQTVSGDSDTSRGKRSSLNLYDESAFLTDEYIETTSAFCLQDSSFKLGGGVDMDLIPDNIPNQLLFCSSASDTDSNFYRKYSEWSKRMFMGDPEYFVASLDCEVIIGATLNGVSLSVPLLSQDKVDSAVRTNPSKASREYYNKFDNDGGDGHPMKRSTIAHNSVVRPPMLVNENNEKRKIAISYDPAHDYDNSAVAVGEYVYDENIGWKLKIQNVINFRQLGDHKKKKNIRTPEQIEEVKDMLVKYNGKGFADYENIEYLYIDAGSGGGGNQIADYFMEDWTDRYGTKHKGLIDREESKEYSSQFPNAVNKLRLVSPKKYRTEMFDDLVELLNLGLIEFTEEYDLKGYLNIPEENSKEIIEETDEITGEVRKINGISYKKYKLSWEEELSLKNIDIAKEEMIAIMRFGGTGGTPKKYDLSPDKKNKIHDDRCYAIAMLAYHLKLLRRENITNRPREKQDISKFLQMRTPQIHSNKLI